MRRRGMYRHPSPSTRLTPASPRRGTRKIPSRQAIHWLTNAAVPAVMVGSSLPWSSCQNCRTSVPDVCCDTVKAHCLVALYALEAQKTRQIDGRYEILPPPVTQRPAEPIVRHVIETCIACTVVTWREDMRTPGGLPLSNSVTFMLEKRRARRTEPPRKRARRAVLKISILVERIPLLILMLSVYNCVLVI
jgi:hypothetical protein